MYKHDYTDLVGGALLILVGGNVSLISITSYPMGAIKRMGPGMFPAALGGVLAILGLVLMIQALRKQGERPNIRVFSPIFVLTSVAAFALLIGPFGLIPAIVAATVIASLAELRVRPRELLMLCVALSAFAPFVFVFCLGLQIPLVHWPF